MNNVIYLLSTGTNTEVSTKAWKYWCKKHNIDFICNSEFITSQVKQYDKIGLVTSDTIIKWDSLNIFDEFGIDDFCGVLDTIDFKRIYTELPHIDASKFINEDVLFFGKNHLHLFEVNKNINHSLQKNKINVKCLTQSWNLLGMLRRQWFHYNWQLKDDQTPFYIKYANVWNFSGIDLSNQAEPITTSELMNRVWNYIREQYK